MIGKMKVEGKEENWEQKILNRNGILECGDEATERRVK